jgi:hypothetical protein
VEEDLPMRSVSVVMATYNGAEFVGEQLRSLAAQTVRPAEVIVGDDGSVDDTVGLVRRFAEHAPFPVHVLVNQRRLGYGENFLQAASRASGEYIAFCDQDDVWCPDKVAVSLDALRASGVDLFVHRASVIDRSGRRVGSFSQGIRRTAVHPPLQLAPWSVFYGCTMMFPRRLLALLDPTRRGPHTFDHHGLLSHDLWVYFLASTLGRVATDTRALIAYRQHGANATPSILGAGIRGWFRGLGLPAHPDSPRAAAADHRAVLLGELTEATDDPQLARTAARAARYWTMIGRLERGRLDMYRPPELRQRLHRGVRLVRAGAYRSYGRGGLGRGLLAKDVAVGVLGLNRRPEWAFPRHPTTSS